MENKNYVRSIVTDLVKSHVIVDDSFKLIKPMWGLTEVTFQNEQDAITKLTAAVENQYSQAQPGLRATG